MQDAVRYAFLCKQRHRRVVRGHKEHLFPAFYQGIRNGKAPHHMSHPYFTVGICPNDYHKMLLFHQFPVTVKFFCFRFFISKGYKQMTGSLVSLFYLCRKLYGIGMCFP